MIKKNLDLNAKAEAINALTKGSATTKDFYNKVKQLQDKIIERDQKIAELEAGPSGQMHELIEDLKKK